MQAQSFFRRVDSIDALRALAVLGVIGNHALHLQGGFIGVDIFFTISGYVITLLLIKKITHQEFSYSDFFIHRTARIIPPLFGVCIIIYIASSYLLFEPEDYKYFTDSFLYQSFFAQNIFFAKEAAEYFRGLEYAKFSLHLWSLAVEEQFYIIYPFIFAIFFTQNLKKIAALITTAFLLSFFFSLGAVDWLDIHIASIFSAKNDLSDLHRLADSTHYYLLHTRAWELSAGALACLFVYKFGNTAASRTTKYLFRTLQAGTIAALIGIILCMFLIKETMEWPNAYSCIPIFLTVYLLVFFHIYGPGYAYFFINNRLTLYIGRSSYSLYLYHWPILAILIYLYPTIENETAFPLIYIFITLVFSHLSYTLLEKKRKLFNPRMSIVVLASFCGFCIIVGNKTFDESKLNADILTIMETGEYAPEPAASQEIPHGDFILFLGDSHAKAIRTVMEKVGNDLNLDVYFIPIMPLHEWERNKHKDKLDLALSPNCKGIFIASRWSLYIDIPDDDPEEQGTRWLTSNGQSADNSTEAAVHFYENLMQFIKPYRDVKILLLSQVPRYHFFPKKESVLYARGIRRTLPPGKKLSEHRQEHHTVSRIFEDVSGLLNVAILDPAEILCSSGTCEWHDGFNLYYSDDDHLSIYGADLLYPLIKQSIIQNCIEPESQNLQRALK